MISVQDYEEITNGTNINYTKMIFVKDRVTCRVWNTSASQTNLQRIRTIRGIRDKKTYRSAKQVRVNR